jgi:hypothetical protein
VLPLARAAVFTPPQALDAAGSSLPLPIDRNH